MADITQNPDYRLVMTFLQNIRPGDMDQESSEQLMMIGQRIQAGGALSDREREMLEAVVGAMPMDPGSAVRGGEMPMGNMPMDPGSAVRRGEMPMGEMPMGEMPMDPGSAVRGREMPSQDGETYSPSSGVTRAPNVMSMEDAIAAGIVAPTMRPQARSAAPMTSPRPQARPMR